MCLCVYLRQTSKASSLVVLSTLIITLSSNYAFKAVNNSERFVSLGIFSFIPLFYLHAFLTGSPLGTFL